jgi:hypothetical protein
MSAFGRSGQFQSGKFNEYEWLLSARSGHQINLENDIVSGRKRSKAHIEVVAVEHCLPKALRRL